MMLREILDKRYDKKAISNEDGFIHQLEWVSEKRNTKWWYLWVEYINETNTWERLSDLKESYLMYFNK